MALLPFFNKYPYTNFEQLNLDYILTETAKFSHRVEVLEEKVEDHETRLSSAEEDIKTLEERANDIEERLDVVETDITTIKDDISGLETRVAANETEISGIKTRLTGDEANISALQNETSNQDVRITTLENQMQTAQGDIVALEGKNQAQDNDITALGIRISGLEEHTVVANPGGTGANLNTISVDGTTYVIPSGGGGGSGTTVTANPAGVLPSDPELTALGIDALNYRIPVTAADKAAIESDISDLQQEYTELSEAVESIVTDIDVIETSFEQPMNHVPVDNEVFFIPGVLSTSNRLTLEPGVYLIEADASINTAAYGSRMRTLGLYVRDRDNNENVSLDKFIIRGDEPPMITQAANMHCTRVIKINATRTFGLAARVYSTSHTNVVYSGLRLAALKLREIS